MRQISLHDASALLLNDSLLHIRAFVQNAHRYLRVWVICCGDTQRYVSGRCPFRVWTDGIKRQKSFFQWKELGIWSQSDYDIRLSSRTNGTQNLKNMRIYPLFLHFTPVPRNSHVMWHPLWFERTSINIQFRLDKTHVSRSLLGVIVRLM
jgi:hypothetical protein